MADDLTPDFTEVVEPETVSSPKRALPGFGSPKPEARAGDSAPRSRRVRAKASKDNASAGPAKPAVEVPEYEPGRIGEALQGTYSQIAMFWGMFDPQCATVLMTNAGKMALSMEKWAKESPQVRAILEKVITTTVVGEVIAAHAPVVVAIAAHHIPAVRAKMNPGMPVPDGSGMPGNAGNADDVKAA